MKKLIVILFLGVCALANAQYTTPRYGYLPNQPNTGISVNYNFKAITDVAGADTFKVQTNAFETQYSITLLDSLALNATTKLKAHFGDRITVIASAASGTPKLKFIGSNWITNGTVTLSTKKRAVIGFIFDGTYWVENYRLVQ